MRAVRFNGSGGNEVIEIAEAAEPSPQRGEVLVRVRAAGLNRADLLQRAGLYPPPPGVRADIPGLEFAGEVLRVGEGVTAWRPGDRVMAIAGGEAQAELAVAHERMLMRIPDGLSFDAAGAIPEAFITAHDALFTQGGMRPGCPVLIHAAGSGVGTAAIQIARAAGAITIGTSRTEEKLERARTLGLDHGIVVPRGAPAFAARVRELTDGQGVPLILDFVGAAYTPENIAALAPQGCLVVIGAMGGVSAQLDLGALLHKRLHVVGTALRRRPLEEKIAATQRMAREVLPLVALGKVKPVVEEAFGLERARDAYARLERNESFGKLVLTP
jgi:NADPH2:quinone reductase